MIVKTFARALGLVLIACSPEAPVRPELVIALDTTAPRVGELAGRPELSADLALDSLRIDALDESLLPYRIEQLVVPERADWPVSFGVAAGERTSVRLRVRAFRGTRADAEVVLGETALKPWGETTIDRLLEIPLPNQGIERVRVVLDAACIGVPANLFQPATTCVDGAHVDGDPTDGVLEDGEASGADASLPLEVPCRGTAGPGRVCIPGGVSVLGDRALAGVEGTYLQTVTPLHPVRVSPFFVDVAEYTVARFRARLRSGEFHGELPAPSAANDAYCAFLGAEAPDNDSLALNCVSRAAAEELCALDGGSLPSEAQWEHAARGRGQARAYPWGDEPPACCVASLDRRSPAYHGDCPGAGPEPSATHGLRATCDGRGDISRDGVLDFGGGLCELVQDSWVPYASDCWAPGLPLDPVCSDSSTPLKGARGGNWSSGLQTSLAALRHFAGHDDLTGFRCVYEDRP